MKRSKFNLSHTRLFTCDMGELVPIGLLECLPGDSIQMQSRALIRLAPLLSPPMHKVDVRIHHYFVPHRLVWSNFEKFITGGPTGDDASVFPYRAAVSISAGTLLNYLGLPVTTLTTTFSALPMRAYQLIWNEYYRDQDLQTEAPISKNDGQDTSTDNGLQKVSWPKDYFTAARPWEQKGAAVLIPIGGVVDISGLAQVREGSAIGAAVTLERGGAGLGAPVQVQQSGGAAGTDFFIDVSGATGVTTGAGVTVNSLRESLALQRFKEARARYGSRYVEYLRAIGVRSSDARLNRPEYLGGGRQAIQFSEVLTTAQDQPTTPNPVGMLRGHGISALRSNRFRRFIEEHGYILSLMSIVPQAIYMNGVHKTWLRRTRYDFWQKELENLGQQPVKNAEVRGNHVAPDGTFGFQDRYDDYRRSWSFVAGEFATTALDYWHFGRSFASDPVLNSSFVSCVPTERPFASSTTDSCYVHVHNSVQARRLVSKQAISRTF